MKYKTYRIQFDDSTIRVIYCKNRAEMREFIAKDERIIESITVITDKVKRTYKIFD